MKRKKTNKPKRFVHQYKFEEHVRWVASAWSSNNEEAAIAQAKHNEGWSGDVRVWDRKKRREVLSENDEVEQNCSD